MRAAVGCFVALLVVTSRMVPSASESVEDKVAPAAVEKVDEGANRTSVAEKMDAHSAGSAPTFVSHSGDVSAHSELGRTLFASAVVFSGVALAAAFVWLVAPFLGYKFCALVGSCGSAGVGAGNGSGSVGNGEDSVIVNGGEEASALFPFSIGYRHSAPYGSYRKRSLNYVGPILKTLSSAYEKFEEFSSTTPKAA